jgi:hypothetical protein
MQKIQILYHSVALLASDIKLSPVDRLARDYDH